MLALTQQPLSLLLAAALLIASAPKHAMAQSDRGSGSGSGTANASTSTVVASLILNGVIFAIEIIAFFMLRPHFRKIYQPRSYLPPSEERSDPQPSHLYNWVPTFIKTPSMEIMRKNGLDAYMFVDFLELMVWIFFPTFVLTWILLMPVYSANTTGGKTGFNKFTYGNIGTGSQEQKRYAATLLIQWVCTFWIMWNVRRRMARFIKLRQDFIVSPEHSSTAQARTVLVTGVPNDVLSEKKLSSLYSHMPGGVEKVWLNRNLKELPDLFADRAKACDKLEAAETKLIKTAYKLVRKGKAQEIPADADAETTLDIADKYVPRKQRPSHKVGKVPCMGEKVDTIEWCREEIARLNEEIEKKRQLIATDYKEYPPQNSAFILFRNQIAAHLAARATAHHMPYRMGQRFLDVHPNDIIWGNLNMNPYEQRVRNAVGWAITFAIVLFWTIPVGFVGIISNVGGLSEKVSWLGWLNKIPTEVLGIIQGILPTVLLAVLNMLLPIFLRLLARLSGIPTRTGVELSLMTRFFIFQVFQNFLVLTIVSGASSGITQFVNSIINNPGQIPSLLAQYIPLASLFFLSFIALQGLTGAASGFLQVVPLIMYYVKKFLLASTPRKVWHVDHDMGSVNWGTLFPNITLITVIAVGYMVIAPIINGFAFVSFGLFWLLYKYLFLYVYDMKPENETSGLFYPKAINHLFVGLYVEMVMLAALFFVAQSIDPVTGSKSQSAIPEGVFMVILIVIVAGFHYVLNDSYGDLYTALPLTVVPAYQGGLAEGHERVSEEGTEQGGEKKPLMRGGVSASEAYSTQESKYGNGLNEYPPSSRLEMHPREPRNSNELSEDAFDPPALKDPQMPVWIPNDRFGIGRAETQAALKSGVKASDENTSVNEKGKVRTDAVVPPGEVLV